MIGIIAKSRLQEKCSSSKPPLSKRWIASGWWFYILIRRENTEKNSKKDACASFQVSSNFYYGTVKTMFVTPLLLSTCYAIIIGVVAGKKLMIFRFFLEYLGKLWIFFPKSFSKIFSSSHCKHWNFYFDWLLCLPWERGSKCQFWPFLVIDLHEP